MNLVRAQRLVPATSPKSWTLPRLEHQAMKPLSLKHPQSLLRKAKKGGVLVPKWECIDLERGDLRVKRQITRINGDKETEVLPVCRPPRTVFCICFTKC